MSTLSLITRLRRLEHGRDVVVVDVNNPDIDLDEERALARGRGLTLVLVDRDATDRRPRVRGTL